MDQALPKSAEGESEIEIRQVFELETLAPARLWSITARWASRSGKDEPDRGRSPCRLRKSIESEPGNVWSSRMNPTSGT